MIRGVFFIIWIIFLPAIWLGTLCGIENSLNPSFRQECRLTLEECEGRSLKRFPSACCKRRNCILCQVDPLLLDYQYVRDSLDRMSDDQIRIRFSP